jgi:hypothetical protein
MPKHWLDDLGIACREPLSVADIKEPFFRLHTRKRAEMSVYPAL